jgi:hypothetical protein
MFSMAIVNQGTKPICEGTKSSMRRESWRNIYGQTLMYGVILQVNIPSTIQKCNIHSPFTSWILLLTIMLILCKSLTLVVRWVHPQSKSYYQSLSLGLTMKVGTQWKGNMSIFIKSKWSTQTHNPC